MLKFEVLKINLLQITLMDCSFCIDDSGSLVVGDSLAQLDLHYEERDGIFASKNI